MYLTEEVVRMILDQFFDGTAMGNRGQANAERVVIDGTNIDFKVVILHKEKKRILGKDVTVYSMTTDVEGKVDVLNPDPNSVSYTVKHSFGGISVSIEDVVEVLAALAV